MKHLTLKGIALLLLAGCMPQIRVYSDYDPGVPVENFRTFDWGQKIDIEAGKNPLYYNELNDKRIKLAVLHELIDHGYQLSETNPDILIHYHIVTDDRSIVTTEPYGYYYGPYWLRMHTNLYPYREGTLIIDVMETKTNNLIWRGWATTALEEISEEETKEIIDRAVEKIFRKFPDSTEPRDTISKS